MNTATRLLNNLATRLNLGTVDARGILFYLHTGEHIVCLGGRLEATDALLEIAGR